MRTGEAAELTKVVIATEGRTYTFDAMKDLLAVSDIASLRGTVPPSEIELAGAEDGDSGDGNSE